MEQEERKRRCPICNAPAPWFQGGECYSAECAERGLDGPKWNERGGPLHDEVGSVMLLGTVS